MAAHLLPLQYQAPFAWPIDPTASDPSRPAFWIAWAAAKCAAEPSIEALWAAICRAAWAFRRLKERLPLATWPEVIHTSLPELQKTYGEYLPKRCFRPRGRGMRTISFLIELYRVADMLDELAEALIHAWQLFTIQQIGPEEVAQASTMDLVLRCRGPEACFPLTDHLTGNEMRTMRERCRLPVPHAARPMPWTAGFLAVIEKTTGSPTTECPRMRKPFGCVHLLRGPGFGNSLQFGIDLGPGGDPILGPADFYLVNDPSDKSHPLADFFGEGFPHVLDEYRAWRALADKPVFQDACKWHPEDEEIA